MGRVSFGGSQDLSGLFAQLYNQYEDRLTTLAERSARRADEEQGAKDADTIDRWQQGEITDEEFLAYAESRVEESADDPEENAYWKKVLRDAEKSLLSEQITDTAEDIIDRIQAGTATWNDLKNYYLRERKKLRPSDPLYDQLSDQIEQVDDQIAQNKVDSAFGQIDYLFRSGQITGAEAGRRLRGLASQFKVNDPGRYWQILSQAADLERHGGLSGSGGSGGGGGGSSAGLNDLIDVLEGAEERLTSLSDQFEAGRDVGSLTYVNDKGQLVTEEFLLRNPDGTPTDQMEAVDDEVLSTLDSLEQAVVDKEGHDSNKAGDVRARRTKYIIDHVQPRNTIHPEQQMNRLLNGFQTALEAVTRNGDPALAWAKVKAAAKELSRWQSRLNTDVETSFVRDVPDDERLAANPELAAAARRQTTVAADEREQTTADFATKAEAAVSYARGIAEAQSVEDLQQLAGALPLIAGAEQANQMLTAAAESVDLVVNADQYARVYVDGAVYWAPVVEIPAPDVDPNTGLPTTRIDRVPVDAELNPIFNAEAGERLEKVLTEINGRTDEILVVSQPSALFLNGEPVDRDTAEAFSKALEGAQVEADYNRIESEFGTRDPKALQSYRQTIAPGLNGRPTAWYYDEGEELWFRDRVTKTADGIPFGGVPVIFSGVNARAAQMYVNKRGLDPSGRSYFNLDKEAAQQSQGRGMLQKQDWYQVNREQQRREINQSQRSALVENIKSGLRQAGSPSSGGVLGGFLESPVGDLLKNAAQSIGVSIAPPTRSRGETGGFLRGFDSYRTPTVTPPRVSVNIPRINLPNLSRLRGMGAGTASRASTATGPRIGGHRERF